MLTKIALLSALASLAAAAPAPAPTSPAAECTTEPDPNVFSGFASRSGSDIQGFSVNARSQKFNLNNGTDTYCPEGIVDCSQAGNSTVFAFSSSNNKYVLAPPAMIPSRRRVNPKELADGRNSLYLKAAVAGGQQVYVAEDGSLSFKGAHSAYIAPPRVAGPFEYTPALADGTSGSLTFQGGSFTACPAGKNPTNGTAYQIFAVAITNPANCIPFQLVTTVWEGATPYQYI
ncbi:hypothetical protein BUE80_DR011004 [Diplocarpon rosae]|nr:hypothetical protein BUE80_DR011004 [Diplocarpon rosae]